MTDDRMPLAELLQKAGDGDFLPRRCRERAADPDGDRRGGLQRSVQLAQAARNAGLGDRDKLAAIAEGQKKQMEVLGLDATVKLRQFELVMQFAQQHPEVVAAMFNNAHKFVPQVTVGTGSEAVGGMLSALLAEMLTRPGALAPGGQPVKEGK